MATPAELDTIINDRFSCEAADDVDGLVSTLADDFVHEFFPATLGRVTNREDVRCFYAWLFQNVHGRDVTPIKRLYGDDFLIDEAMWHGEITDGAPLGFPGLAGTVDVRMLHVLEVQDGKVRREQVWYDSAALQEQLS